MKKTTILLSAITLLIATVILNQSCSKEKDNTATLVSAETYKANMRTLWEDHITWTRNVIFCLVDDLPGTGQAVERLLKNQVDIGNAFKPYYGEEAGNRLTQLLTPHITISAEVVKAAKDGNAVVLKEASERWYANADEISEFLCKINPNWKLTSMKTMMHFHLNLATDEAMHRINKNYESDVVNYDIIHLEILRMSDMFADGIATQFPSKFK